MGNEEYFEDALEKIRKNQEQLNKIITSAVSPQLQAIAAAMQPLSSTIISAFQSEAMQAVVDIGNHISSMISAIDFKPALNGLSQALIPFRYIELLKRLKWPIFLIGDETLRENIMDVCKDKDDIEAVTSIILDYCNNDFVNGVDEDWCQCEAINPERKPILSQALLMHKNEYYYASTSILMCQVYGIAGDIVKLVKENGLELDTEEKNLVSEYYEININDIDKEKGKLIQMTTITESGQLLWNAMASYLKEEILCSSDSKQRWETQPLRNKICHGDQLDFGTKEHSLKAILTVDMLIQLAYEIRRIVELNNEAIDEQEEGNK